MVLSGNSVDLAHRLPNADLVLYEDAAHGARFQYHHAFVKKALDFPRALIPPESRMQPRPARAGKELVPWNAGEKVPSRHYQSPTDRLADEWAWPAKDLIVHVRRDKRRDEHTRSRLPIRPVRASPF